MSSGWSSMFNWRGRAAAQEELRAQAEAIRRSQAVISFELDGTIRDANDRFVTALGYASAEELRGRPHSMLVGAAEAAAPAYRELWSKLGRGESVAGLQLAGWQRRPVGVDAGVIRSTARSRRSADRCRQLRRGCLRGAAACRGS